MSVCPSLEYPSRELLDAFAVVNGGSMVRTIGGFFRFSTAKIQSSSAAAIQAPTSLSEMSRSARDIVYRVYITIHIFATVFLTVPAVLPSSLVPEVCLKPVQWYLANYNDPLVGKKGSPGGWFGGFSACEAWLQLPYFLWAITLPIGSIEVRILLIS